MLDRLIASRRRPDVRRGSAAGAIALMLHATLVGGAIYATLRADEAPTPPLVVVPDFVLPLEPPPAGPDASPRLEDAPGSGLPPIGPPLVEPPDLPRIEPGHGFDPRRYARPGATAASGSGAASGGDRFYAAALVEDPPVVLSGPSLVYPALMRQAGLEGRVVIEAIIDSSGRAEPGSITVTRSPHPAFEGPARDFVRRALFRPGRMQGRPVRVLVRLPIEFALR
jgi:TonB family protein